MGVKGTVKQIVGCVSLICLMGCSSEEIAKETPEMNLAVSVENMDVVQPLGNIMELPQEDAFWMGLYAASKSTLRYADTKAGDVDDQGAVLSIKDEFVIADSATMDELMALCGEAPIREDEYIPVVPLSLIHISEPTRRS